MKIPMRRYILISITAAAAALLTGCGTALKPVTPPSPFEAEWHEVRLPGKRVTAYHWEHFDGRRALAARSESSASMMRRKLLVSPSPLGKLNFSWQVLELIDGSDVSTVETEDAPARVLLEFGGDVSTLPMRTRMLYELTHTLSGEVPPYATLMYVWDRSAPIGSVIVNPRTDRIRKIVVDSGPDGLKRWRDHTRDMAEDFRRAFGEEPGPLLAVAVMTDSDNTKSKARAWYGPRTLD